MYFITASAVSTYIVSTCHMCQYCTLSAITNNKECEVEYANK